MLCISMYVTMVVRYVYVMSGVLDVRSEFNYSLILVLVPPL